MHLPLLSLAFASSLFCTTLEPSPAQAPCTSVLSANTSTVSVTTGGTQVLSLQTNAPFRVFSIVGSFSSGPSEPYFSYGGLHLTRDRYLMLSYLGRSPFLPGGEAYAPGGHQISTDALGAAVKSVVVPPGQWFHLVGQTVRHGVYTIDPQMLLPDCGSNVVSLTFVP
ncbi:MAG: hypothetical protein NTV21_13950 [Planctomycetota bacterium]|nr:hypothetical protein [Planctomycetota bacterium]